VKQNTDALQNQSEWPDGWYVYDNNKVEGPFTASQAFAREAMTGDGRQVLVSRKGFTQWYALKDLAEIFKMTENLGRRVAEEQQQLKSRQYFEPVAVKKAAEPDPGRRVVKKQVGPAAQPTPIEPAKSTAAAPVQAAPVTGTRQASAVVNMPAYVPPAAKPSRKSGKKSDATETPVVKEAKTQTPAKAPVSEKQRLLQEYFFVRARLRLGKIRNPWAAAFFGVPFSAGLFWPFWMHAILKEIYQHATNKAKVPVWIVLASVVPGLHLYAIYKTASLMRAMEMQNRYSSISPAVAALFGLFPPFALAYIQDGANRHWILHARHSGVGTKQEN
jgi:hypothetical protein